MMHYLILTSLLSTFECLLRVHSSFWFAFFCVYFRKKIALKRVRWNDIRPVNSTFSFFSSLIFLLFFKQLFFSIWSSMSMWTTWIWLFLFLFPYIYYVCLFIGLRCSCIEIMDSSNNFVCTWNASHIHLIVCVCVATNRNSNKLLSCC